MTFGLLNIANAQLEYRWYYPPLVSRHRPTIVLLHEGLGCVALWKQFPARLAETTGLTVFSYSRAGYGNSSPISLPRSLDFHRHEALEVLPAVLKAAAIERCILIGHSDGASIAIIYAGEVTNGQADAVVAMAPHVLTEAKTVSAVRQAIANYDSGELRTNLARYHGANTECAFRGWSEVWTAPDFGLWNIEACLDAMTIPLLAIRGEEDPYNSEIHLNAIGAATRADAKTLSLPGCGHAPHIEQPPAVLTAIKKFLVARDVIS